MCFGRIRLISLGYPIGVSGEATSNKLDTS